jgi:VWFA-related protein
MDQMFAWSLFLAVALMPCQASDQALQPSSGPASGASVASDAVLLDLVVHDKRGKPVVDLKPEELSVTDDGDPVTLNSLRLVSGEQQSEHLITLVFDRPSAERGIEQQSSAAIMKEERDTAAKILKMTPQNGFAFSVFSIERRLRLQQGFTADRNALAQAINSATEAERPGSDSAANGEETALLSIALTGADASGKRAKGQERILAQALYGALKSSGPISRDQHIRPSLAGLLALTQAQQEIAQRKAIIYFSSIQDKQIDSHARAAVESIIGTAARAGVSIYVVDMNSINGNGSQTVILSDVPSDASGYTGPTEGFGLARRSTEVSLEKTDVMDMLHLAEQTGGSYISGDRLMRSVEQLIGDMTTYYEASYLPQIKEYDGNFRPVVVKPLRAGLKIRTQTGYLALPPRSEDGSRPQPFEIPLSKLLKQTPLPAELAFRAAVLTMGNHSEGDASTLAIEVPLTSLDLRRDSNTPTYTAHFSMVANIRDQDGALVEHFSANAPERVTLSNPEMKSSEAITLQRHFAAPVGKYVLEAAILDLNGGTAGAQRIPFEISKVAGTPSLSNIVLVRRTDPVGSEEDPSEPLRQGPNRVTPNLSGALPPGASSVSVFFATHTDPHVAEEAKLAIEVLRDGKPLGGAPIIAQQVNGNEYASYLSSFSINSPKDGAYQVKVLLSQGGKTAEAQTSFVMTGVSSAEADAATDSSDSADATRPVGPLAITFPSNPIQRPGADELKSIIADATRFAMDYRESLPNFMCQQVTDRSVSSDGEKTWKHKDKVTGQLTYLDHAEDWSFLEAEQDGHKSHNGDGTETEKGISSAGIFGAVISGLFRPSSKAEIVWKETGVLGDGTVQVFNYRVAQENSNLNLRVGPTEVITVGYHGLVYIDSRAHSVRRITEIADGVPKKYPIHATSVSADYDYVFIGGHDYLMPIGAQVILKKGNHETDLNEIGFRDFHRFGATAKILADSVQ